MLQWATDRWKFRRAARSAVLAATQSRAEQRPGAARDVVLVPCWRRPEMLWHCIDNICKADGVDSLHIIFRADSGFDPDNLAVIREHACRAVKRIPEITPFRVDAPYTLTIAMRPAEGRKHGGKETRKSADFLDLMGGLGQPRKAAARKARAAKPAPRKAGKKR